MNIEIKFFFLDAPLVRQSDISFALTVVLHALNPPSQPRAATAATAKNVAPSGTGESRGSLSVHSDTRTSRSHRPTLLQVAFLGMKVLMTCFNHQLSMDWPRVARSIREIGDRKDGGTAFWNFLIFVATQRGPLFPLILPLMWNKVTFHYHKVGLR